MLHPNNACHYILLSDKGRKSGITEQKKEKYPLPSSHPSSLKTHIYICIYLNNIKLVHC